jgi:hypothetical protein
MPGYIESSADRALFESYNQGRAFAGASLDGIGPYAQWSAALDSKTCDWCGWADLRVFDTRIEPYDPPVHWGCRCIIAYIKSDEYTPEPDWSEGPPKQSFPPGTRGGTDRSGRPVVRGEGKSMKPSPNQEAAARHASAWQEKFGSRATHIQDRTAMPAGEVREWQRAAMEELTSKQAVQLYDEFMKTWTGSYPPESFSIFEAALSGSADDIVKFAKQYVTTEEKARTGIASLRELDKAEEFIKAVRAQQELTREVLRTAGLVDSEGMVTIYRGLKVKPGTFSDDFASALRAGDLEQSLSTRVVESWTTDIKVAEKFAKTDGIVLTKKVPADDVLSYFHTDGAFARHKESEIIWGNGSRTIVPKRVEQEGKKLVVELW